MALLAMSGAASACNGLPEHDVNTTLQYLDNELQPDRVLTQWRPSILTGGEWNGCAHGTRYSVTFYEMMSALDYVRDVSIDGVSYPAYGWADASPLLVFSYATWAGGNERRFPVLLHHPTSRGFTAELPGIGSQIFTGVEFRVVSRGGPMVGGEDVRLWGESILDGYPKAGRMTHQLSMSIRIPALPCTLSDASLVLPAVSAGELAQVGQTAATRDLDVRITCPGAGSLVSLVMDDLNGTTGSVGELMPTADSDARGVNLRVLRNGQPVPFGRSWEHGPTQAGDSIIRFSAQYIRSAGPLQPGTVRGQATLTATYR